MATKRAAERAPKVKATNAQPNAITIRGSAAWKEWLDQFAAKCRLKPTQLIDTLLAEKASEMGFTEPPPRIPS
jgi:hypothetical protein